jgi:hypothetical protein
MGSGAVCFSTERLDHRIINVSFIIIIIIVVVVD